MPRSRSRSRSPRRPDDSRARDHDRDRDRHRSDRRRSRSRDGDRERGRDQDRERKRRKSQSRSRSPDERKEKKRKHDHSNERKKRKEEKRRAREDEEARQLAELSVYSAADNPFHDTNLGQQFKWHKKSEKDRKAGLSAAEISRRDTVRKQDAKEELERLNKRRADREVEMKLREDEEMRMARLTESAQMAEWIAKDDDFQLDQERTRAAIRLKDKRAKAVDFLALNLKYASPNFGEDADEEQQVLDDAGLEIDLDEPYTIFENLTIEQVDELHDDIQHYLSLEKDDLNKEFWTNMMVVCKNWMERLRSAQSLGRDQLAQNAAVESDIDKLLTGKTYDQLVLLQRQVQAKLGSGEPVDSDYWEGLLKSLLVWKAKSKLKALHEIVVRNRLEQLRKRQRDEAFVAQQELLQRQASGIQRSSWGGDMRAEPSAAVDVSNQVPEAVEPPLLDSANLRYEDRQLKILDAVEDRKALFVRRQSVAGTRFVAKAVPKTIVEEPEQPAEEPVLFIESAPDVLYHQEMENDVEEQEEAFNAEEELPNMPTYSWEDKYRPRKPKYFNRVHTGYEWNKYNQTHYDTDNPPPKVVQGYKFNIFYPDLIDKRKAPTFKIVKEPGNDETVLLHFSAGPPYEDIAFRIVNRDWEYSHKRGFRSSFDTSGTLSLWFQFKRSFYRK
ncbi:mid region of cactin-domain-containing protein [Auriculariales sp. MPI-PUGE-AT-0066]|nr:mid region of cactin-domain-containing protein [Auriculariales sp. MPI-PUGE-AT-0066]